jgi:DNA adenine methylase
VIGFPDHEEAFHYVDPPHYQADMEHYGGYTVTDFEWLFQVLTTLKGKFMLRSYSSGILSEYVTKAGWRMTEYDLSRAAGGGRKTEVLTMNYEQSEASAIAA